MRTHKCFLWLFWSCVTVKLVCDEENHCEIQTDWAFTLLLTHLAKLCWACSVLVCEVESIRNHFSLHTLICHCLNSLCYNLMILQSEVFLWSPVSLFLPHLSMDSRYIYHSLSYINLAEREKNKQNPLVKLSSGSPTSCRVCLLVFFCAVTLFLEDKQAHGNWLPLVIYTTGCM